MAQQIPPQQPVRPQPGPLPQVAQVRLNQMRGDSAHHGLFTSNLSVNEFLLTREAGFEPLGMVLGSSIYHIGWQVGNWNKNQEMGILTQALYNARALAMARMVEEASMLGADGVIGVRIEITTQQWETELAEFVAVGTAI